MAQSYLFSPGKYGEGDIFVCPIGLGKVLLLTQIIDTKLSFYSSIDSIENIEVNIINIIVVIIII